MSDISTKNRTRARLMAAMDPLPGLVSGSALKLAAIITMAIDHFAACVVYAMLLNHAFPGKLDFNTVYPIYTLMRGIGRTAFPIYCFLLVEGLMHTRSRAKYLADLLIFALISELPFDLALTLSSKMDSFDIRTVLLENAGSITAHQNVFFTLALGLAACWVIEACRERFGMGLRTVLAAIPAIGLSAYAADILNTDYHSVGVLLITALYLFRPLRLCAAASGFFILTRLNSEQWGFPAFILMLFYNGKRGFLGRSAAVKYFFYIFYPAHLTLFFILRVLFLSSV